MAGNLQLGLVSGQNQNIAALANVNLDFSIIKFAAPPEYSEVGLAISPKRRREAEDGQVHTVARKLALLFCDDLPEIPNLVKAYGIRATEIAKNSKVNPRGTPIDGPFQENIGIDGTSLWASATSGKGAVAVHLLACMLSRIWKGRAIAIWAEMVSSRKSMLQERIAGETFSIDEATAAAIQISRDQLSEWDASARAWIESADIAFSRKQTQTRLILDNLGLELPSSPDIYKAVTSTWKAALDFMENIVGGIPQAVRSGEVLLALSSWHLYPDIEVLYGHTQSIRQNDPLIARGGIVTIGLQNPNVADELGISWSLPLSYLQYYGKPVMATGAINTKSSRVTMEQLLLVAFGCVIKDWITDTNSTATCAKFFVALGNALVDREPPGWFKVLVNVAVTYLESEGKSRENADRLIAFGQRRCPYFLDQKGRSVIPSAFGLTEPKTFIKILGHSESQIKWLRERLADRCRQSEYWTKVLEFALIFYPVNPHEVEHLTMGKAQIHSHYHHMHPDSLRNTYSPAREWASGTPNYKDEKGQPCHRRWLSTLIARDTADLETGYERVASIAVARSEQLKEATNEECAFGFRYNRFGGGDRMQSLQSHLKISPIPPLLGYQLPRRPMSRPIPRAMPRLTSPRTLRPKLYDLNEERESFQIVKPGLVSYMNTVALSSFGKFIGRSLSSTTEVSSYSANLEEEKKRISRIIRHELESNPGNGDLKSHTIVEVPEMGSLYNSHGHHSQGDTSPGMSSIDVDTDVDNIDAHNKIWDCMDPIHPGDCLYKWYIPTRSGYHGDSQSYDRIFATDHDICVYVPSVNDHFSSSGLKLELPTLTLEELTEALEGQKMNGDALLRHLDDSLPWASQKISLDALEFAAEIYSNLPDARVELSITKSALHQYHWAKPRGEGAAHARALSCIAAFESGDLNIQPDDLREVMAISSGNSLYISPLLCSDPFKATTLNTIRRCIGNIGKGGIAFLISPNDPKMKDPGYDSWESVQHNEFDGKLENNFPETSLHLSLTGYELPLNTGLHGLRDKDAYFLQAAVQAYERGVWMADLDILGALKTAKPVPLIWLAETCEHQPRAASTIEARPITSIDCWAEVLDPPENTSIVRSKGNWLARLATTVVAAQQQRVVLIAPEKVCWTCVVESSKQAFPITIIC